MRMTVQANYYGIFSALYLSTLLICLVTIADDIVAIDRAMKWGFGWEMGPFETWDAMGVEKAISKME